MASFCKSYSKKGKVMAYPHIVSALSTKLSQIQGEIELHHKAIKELEIKSKALKQSLLIFDESFDTSMIKAKCKRTRYFKPRELKALIINALKQNTELTLNQIVDFVIQAKGFDKKISDEIALRVRQTLAYLVKKGNVYMSKEIFEQRFRVSV